MPIVLRIGTGRPCRPAKAARHWSPGIARSGRRPAPRRRKSSGRRRRRPIAAQTVLRAVASAEARSRSAPPVQRRQPLLLRPEWRPSRTLLSRHRRRRRRRLSRSRPRVSPCSFPGIAGPARRPSAHLRRPSDNQSGMRCEWRKSVRWSAVRLQALRRPLVRRISPALSLRPPVLRISAPLLQPAWRAQPLPRRAPRSGNSTRGSTCSSAGIAARPRRLAECWNNAPCNRNGTAT